MCFAEKAIKYFCNLKAHSVAIDGVEIINPYNSDGVKDIVKKFYDKFYNDTEERIFIIGINPGRFGGGLTGIAFTDPVALRNSCGVDNNLGSRKELSSKFIFSAVQKFGGAEKFFSRVFLTALYPFAIIRNGKNYNYYDEKYLAELLKEEIVENIKTQIKFGARRDFALSLGRKNTEYFLPLNDKHKFFRKLITLEHPRYIMQYRLKKIDNYIEKYIEAINQ